MRQILRKIILPVIGNVNMLVYVCLGIFSGLCSFLFINAVTRIIAKLIAGSYTTVNKEQVIIFFSVVLFFIWTRKTLSLKVISLSQLVFWKLRKEMLYLILHANYEQLIKRKNKIQTALVSDIQVLTDASINLIGFFTSIIITIASSVYLASISVSLFLITIFIAFLGIAVYRLQAKKNMRGFEKVRKLEYEFFASYSAIMHGFKEIYIEPKKGKYVYEHNIKRIAAEAYKHNSIALTGFLNNSITGQVLFYILISSLLLFFSVTLNIKTDDIISFVFTVIYLFGAIETIMVLLPGLSKARVSINQMMDLRNELEEGSARNKPVVDKVISKEEFENITVREMEFRYEEEKDGFGIGPVSLDIHKGDIMFIYGGNGSGKTTFINCLLGLYIPFHGKIEMNEMPVNNDTYSTYRTLFAVVFSDFYLFDDLGAIENIDIDKCNYYLELFELDGKVKFENSRFSTTDLSTGQRKRLALIAALLENKPILVLDEWAADQDPYFKRKFYTKILPSLKEEGFTVIAITHDDKYYCNADKLYKVEFGKLIQDNVSIYL